MKEESCDSFCGDGLLCGTKNHPLSKPMVDHDQKRVEATERWEVSDEITGDLLEQASGNRANRSKGGNGGVCWTYSVGKPHTHQHICGQKLQGQATRIWRQPVGKFLNSQGGQQ